MGPRVIKDLGFKIPDEVVAEFGDDIKAWDWQEKPVLSMSELSEDPRLQNVELVLAANPRKKPALIVKTERPKSMVMLRRYAQGI
jgi:hypothetical protein